jgi:Mn-dependent DtxR family transcriptional regulator
MSIQLTASQEHYLENILHLWRRVRGRRPLRVAEIAAAMRVSRPSVSRAVGLLERLGLVRHHAYGEVRITPLGERAAQAVMRRDRCLTRLLVEVLAMPADAAQTQVCRLEHLVDGDLLARLEVRQERLACRFARSQSGSTRRPEGIVKLTSLAALLVFGWIADPAAAADPKRRVLVASTTQIADFARQVVGDAWAVRTILAPGADPHTYQPTPGDAQIVRGADSPPPTALRAAPRSVGPPAARWGRG